MLPALGDVLSPLPLFLACGLALEQLGETQDRRQRRP
jgi:hypothetical protein